MKEREKAGETGGVVLLSLLGAGWGSGGGVRCGGVGAQAVGGSEGGGRRSAPPFGILRGACCAQGLVRRGEPCGQTERGLPAAAPEVSQFHTVEAELTHSRPVLGTALQATLHKPGDWIADVVETQKFPRGRKNKAQVRPP